MLFLERLKIPSVDQNDPNVRARIVSSPEPTNLEPPSPKDVRVSIIEQFFAASTSIRENKHWEWRQPCIDCSQKLSLIYFWKSNFFIKHLFHLVLRSSWPALGWEGSSVIFVNLMSWDGNGGIRDHTTRLLQIVEWLLRNDNAQRVTWRQPWQNWKVHVALSLKSYSVASGLSMRKESFLSFRQSELIDMRHLAYFYSWNEQQTKKKQSSSVKFTYAYMYMRMFKKQTIFFLVDKTIQVDGDHIYVYIYICMKVCDLFSFAKVTVYSGAAIICISSSKLMVVGDLAWTVSR